MLSKFEAKRYLFVCFSIAFDEIVVEARWIINYLKYRYLIFEIFFVMWRNGKIYHLTTK